MAEEFDYSRGAKKSLTYEVDQKVVMFMTPIVDGVRQEPITYDNWDAAIASAEGGAERAKEQNPDLQTEIVQVRNYCIETKLSRARKQRSEETEKARSGNKRADLAQENMVRFRNEAKNIRRQAKEEVANVLKDRAGKQAKKAE